MATVIEEALAMVEKPVFRPASTIDAEIEELEARERVLLGVESDQADVIRDRIAELEQDKEASLFVESRREPPQVLSPEVLTWRHAKGIKGVPVPKLAPLSTDRPTCRFSAARLSYVRFPSFTDNVPSAISDSYADVREGIGRRVSRWRVRSVELSWRFEGVIPDDVRGRIVLYLDDFEEDDLFLLADAPLETWQYRQRRQVRDERPAPLRDPLVVGAKAGRLWLLDAFDPTPIERYVADEFTQRLD